MQSPAPPCGHRTIGAGRPGEAGPAGGPPAGRSRANRRTPGRVPESDTPAGADLALSDARAGGTDVATVARPEAAGRAGPHRPAPHSDPRLVPSGPPLGDPPTRGWDPTDNNQCIPGD